MSALAQYYLARGWRVSGSDVARSEITDDLKRRGVKIFIGQKAKNVRDAELVIYSAAIKSNNPELAAVLKSGVQTKSYAQAVGELTKKYYTIAISGSHGKSTTTALIGLILIKAGLDPTIIVGTKLKELGGCNFRLGKSKYLVLEADEYARSFHNYFPKIAVITNIDKEHLDTYKNLKGVLTGFRIYLKNVSDYIVANREDENIRKIIKSPSFATPPHKASEVHSKATKGEQNPKPKIIWYKMGSYKLLIPGIHNQFNAEAAWQTVKLLGVKKSAAEKVFKSYRGAWRRMELLATSDKRQVTRKGDKNHVSCLMSHVTIYSDYAHHPTEIRVTLQALKEKYHGKKIVCIFQPHQQDRLTRLFKEFAQAFRQADKTILYPLYKVKGRDVKGKTSEDLSKAIKQANVYYTDGFKALTRLIKPDLKSKSVIVFMSAGDLDGKARQYFGAR